MDKLIIASTRKNAGKTSLIIGMAKAKGEKFGYIKPFGDRLFYRKKRLWDYDSALMVNIFNLEGTPEDLSIGFDHAKIRYMYDEKATGEKLSDLVSDLDAGNTVFIEGGRDLFHGASVHLDAISLARHTGGKLIIVLSGEDGTIMDDLVFVKRYVDLTNVDFRGIILNKLHDYDDFRETNLADIEKMGIDVIGIIPYERALTYLSVNTLVERLFVKVIAGAGGLNKIVKNIFIGAMSADAAHQDPLFKRESKLIITAGDRSDMIVAALESDTACLIITNNIVPSPTILSKASESNIPLLLAAEDTYQVATQIDGMDMVMSKDEIEKIDMLGKIAEKYIYFDKI